MTWLGDKVKVSQDEADRLMAKRAKLVSEIEQLEKNNLTFRSQAAARGHLEDLTNLAKKITSIDKKLGRV